jgi:hypothetical protein
LTDTYKPPARYSSKGEKRRKPGKKLNLFGEENIRAQLLYSSTLQAAESYAAEKEAIEQPGKAEKEAKKVLAAENKQKKEAEAQEKALQRQLDKEVRLMSVQTGAIALVSLLMFFLFFRSGRKAGSYLFTSADDADDVGDADDADLAKTLLPTLAVFLFVIQ